MVPVLWLWRDVCARVAVPVALLVVVCVAQGTWVSVTCPAAVPTQPVRACEGGRWRCAFPHFVLPPPPYSVVPRLHLAMV